jgi:TPR repeat protein
VLSGDQLALYLEGVRLYRAGEMLAAFFYFLRAAEGRPAVDGENCRDIDRMGTYRCSQGLPEAHYSLGLLYLNCEFVGRDAGKALTHLQIAARLGEPHSLARLPSAIRWNRQPQSHCSTARRN